MDADRYHFLACARPPRLARALPFGRALTLTAAWPRSTFPRMMRRGNTADRLAFVAMAAACAMVAALAPAARGQTSWGPAVMLAQQSGPSPPAAAATPPSAAENEAEQRRTAQAARLQRMAEVRSWGYQLRLIDPFLIRSSPLDLVVVDHGISAFRRFVRQFGTDEVAIMRERAEGKPRIVLSYLSIGEAERYRFYWNQDWYDPPRKPPWLGDVNPVWDGNYLVKFWERDWQALIFGGPEAYLERIVAQGFDGIYLDRADVFLEWQQAVPDAEARMVDFLVRLASHARKVKPDLIIVMQNAEELLKHAGVRMAIDAIAKEDLYYGIDHAEGRNANDTVEWSVKDLKIAQRAGRRVLAVEYLSDARKIADAKRRAAKDGFLMHVTVRDLGQLTLEHVDAAPVTQAPKPAAGPSSPSSMPARPQR